MIKGSSTSSNVLLTLGVLFTIGGATRFIPNMATAEEATTPAPAAEAESAKTASLATSETETRPSTSERTRNNSAPLESVCFTDEAAEALADDQWMFEQEEEAQRERKLALDTRQLELDRQANELEALHETLETRWAQMRETSDEDLLHLAKMYGAMKPSEAATIFDQMDPGFAAGFLKLMPSDQAGQVLAGMESGKAYIVSVKLASINADIRSSSQMN